MKNKFTLKKKLKKSILDIISILNA